MCHILGLHVGQLGYVRLCVERKHLLTAVRVDNINIDFNSMATRAPVLCCS